MRRCMFRELLLDREYREDRRIFLKEISEKTGLSRSLLSNVIHHRQPPTRRTIKKLCFYFNCKTGDLMVEVPDMNAVVPKPVPEFTAAYALKELTAEKEFKEKRAISRHEVGFFTGLGPVAVSELYNGERPPTIDEATKLLTYFGCTKTRWNSFFQQPAKTTSNSACIPGNQTSIPKPPIQDGAHPKILIHRCL